MHYIITNVVDGWNVKSSDGRSSDRTVGVIAIHGGSDSASYSILQITFSDIQTIFYYFIVIKRDCPSAVNVCIRTAFNFHEDPPGWLPRSFRHSDVKLSDPANRQTWGSAGAPKSSEQTFKESYVRWNNIFSTSSVTPPISEVCDVIFNNNSNSKRLASG